MENVLGNRERKIFPHLSEQGQELGRHWLLTRGRSEYRPQCCATGKITYEETLFNSTKSPTAAQRRHEPPLHAIQDIAESQLTEELEG
jgi:hypothetical protein